MKAKGITKFNKSQNTGLRKVTRIDCHRDHQQTQGILLQVCSSQRKFHMCSKVSLSNETNNHIKTPNWKVKPWRYSIARIVEPLVKRSSTISWLRNFKTTWMEFRHTILKHIISIISMLVLALESRTHKKESGSLKPSLQEGNNLTNLHQ